MIKKIHFYFLSILLLGNLLFVGVSYAQTAGSGPSGTSQNAIGDVIDGLGNGAPIPRTLGTITNVIQRDLQLNVGNAPIIANLIGNGANIGGIGGCSDVTSAITQIDALFSILPIELESTFMDTLFTLSSDACAITELVEKFTDLNNLLEGLSPLNGIPGLSCNGSGGPLSEGFAYAKNAIITELDPTKILGSSFAVDLTSGIDLGSLFPSLPFGNCTPEPFSDAKNVPVIGTGTNTPLTGPVVTSQSDCSSNWQSMRGTLPSTMENPDLLYNIKRASIELGMDPNQLAGVMWLESRGDPNLANYAGCPKASAIGLIQFIKATAQELGMHSISDCTAHQNAVRALGIEGQMDYVIKYYQKRGWEAGMTDYQAYATVHHGNPHGGSQDGITGQSTEAIFNTGVLPKMDAFRCGGFDWNTFTWVEGA